MPDDKGQLTHAEMVAAIAAGSVVGYKDQALKAESQVPSDEQIAMDHAADALVGKVVPALNIVTIDDTDSPYTLDGTEDVLLCDATDGAITVNLLSAALASKPVDIKNSGQGSGVTVSAHGAEAIDNDTGDRGLAASDHLRLLPSSSAWWIIGGYKAP